MQHFGFLRCKSKCNDARPDRQPLLKVFLLALFQTKLNDQIFRQLSFSFKSSSGQSNKFHFFPSDVCWEVKYGFSARLSCAATESSSKLPDSAGAGSNPGLMPADSYSQPRRFRQRANTGGEISKGRPRSNNQESSASSRVFSPLDRSSLSQVTRSSNADTC